MTPDEREKLDAIERDRKKRELALLLALLLMLEGGRRFIQHGIADSGELLTPKLDRLPEIIRRAMADAYVGGLRRAGFMAGVPLVPIGVDTTDLPDYQAGLGIHRAVADQAAEALRTGMLAVATTAYNDARAAGLSRSGIGRAVNQALTRYGFTARSPDTIDPTATGKPGYAAMRTGGDAIINGYNTGLWHGYHSPPSISRLTAFRHLSIIDSRTSEYCDLESGRQGLTLPPTDPYWLRGFPPLHARCRSVILPVYDSAVEYSEFYPTIPPAPGWGKAPATAFGTRVGRAA